MLGYTKTNSMHTISTRPLLTLIFASVIMVLISTIGILTNQHLQVSLFNKQINPIAALTLASVERIDPEAYSFDPETLATIGDDVVVGKYGEWSYCDYSMPETPLYSADLLLAEIQEEIVAGEIFTVDMTFKNTGNTRLFSHDSGCTNLPIFSVGTQKAMDRESIFGTNAYAVSGWVSPQRIAMKEAYADPGEAFHVRWQSVAPADHDNDMYREFFQPVIEGVSWIGEVFAYDIEIGTPTEKMRNDMQFVSDASVNAMTLDGLERNLTVNLKEQRMYARFGDIPVWSMPISSGHWETPTPRGEYTIYQKQELRIGGKAPHYRMPWWQMWDARGYGIHGLPYLGSERGHFWKEAEDHIGRPVSHGCIRTLDRDAETLYNFTTLGTPLSVK